MLAIVGKQISVNIKTYGAFLPSHLNEITRTIQIENEEFNILNENHRNKLLEATHEEAKDLKEQYLEKYKKGTLSEKEKIECTRLNYYTVEEQFDKMVDFAEKRKEELIKQGIDFSR